MQEDKNGTIFFYMIDKRKSLDSVLKRFEGVKQLGGVQFYKVKRHSLLNSEHTQEETGDGKYYVQRHCRFGWAHYNIALHRKSTAVVNRFYPNQNN